MSIAVIEETEDNTYPENPSPTNSFADEATDNGTKDRATVRGSSEKRDSETTLLIVPDVRDGTARERQWRGREKAAQETTDQQRLDILSDGAWDDEDDVDDAREDPNWPATDDLALWKAPIISDECLEKEDETYQWRPKQRADTETADHECHSERGHDLADVEVRFKVLEIAGDDRGSEGNLDNGHSAHKCDVCDKSISVGKERHT